MPNLPAAHFLIVVAAMPTPKRYPAQTLDFDRYIETFAVFVPRSGEYPAMIRRLVETAAVRPEGFSCLDVGAGPGMVIRDWVSKRGRQPGRYVAIEPNAAHAASLRDTLKELGLAGEVFEEAFDPQFPIPGTFDLVLFSHSLYWMPEAAECVRHAHAALKPGGTVVAFLSSPLGAYALYHLFNPLLARDRPTGPNHGFSSHELIVGLRAVGLEPSVTYDPTPLDLTGLFDDEARHEREEFLSFCLQIEFAQLDEPLKSDILDYLRAACVEQDGRLNWYEPTATVHVGAGGAVGKF